MAGTGSERTMTVIPRIRGINARRLRQMKGVEGWILGGYITTPVDSPPPVARVRRSGLVYSGLVAAAVLAGLASRRYADLFPDAVRLYFGDVSWAAMVYFAAAALWPRARVSRIALGALAFSLVIETSQLYHAPWIDALRATRPGALVLGFGFLWSDVACYAIGVGLASLIDRAVVRRGPSRSLRQGRERDIVS
jgi:hypothetical protein